MRKITKREDGRYMMGLPHKKGEPRRFIYGRTPEEVQRKYERVTGKSPPPSDRPGSVNEFVRLHFAPWLRSRVRAASLRRYESMYVTHIFPVMGNLRFSEITPDVIGQAINRFNSGNSQSLARSLIGQIFTLAIAYKKADHHLLAILQTQKIKPRKPKPRLNVEARADELLRNLEGHFAYGIIWTIVTLGLRKGEACGLMASDLSADNILTIQRQRTNLGVKDYLKKREAGESRRIALPVTVAARLRSLMAPEGYAFRGEKGEPISYNHLDRYIKAFQPPEPLTIHDMRSVAASRMKSRGVDDFTLMDIMGHQDRKVLESYVDTSDERMRKALEP